MASIVFLMSGGIGTLGGLATGTALFTSRYLFNSTNPLYIGIAIGLLSSLGGLYLWKRKRINENKEREIFHPDYIIGTGFVTFGVSSIIPVAVLPLLVSISISLYKYIISPATNILTENIKHQHGL